MIETIVGIATLLLFLGYIKSVGGKLAPATTHEGRRQRIILILLAFLVAASGVYDAYAQSTTKRDTFFQLLVTFGGVIIALIVLGLIYVERKAARSKRDK